ncbi:MAG: hypothetical protein PHX61_12445 [Alphaproteobacteria bacterium]|nr:hypothetical protein [Alphaproteobacteria bacterium]
MKIRVGLVSLFNIIIILVLITLTFNCYKQSQSSASLIDQNLVHNLTYLEARSKINRFINDSQEMSLAAMHEKYDFKMAANTITYREDLDYGQTITLILDYYSGKTISLQVSNDSNYTMDDLAPVYKGE